MQTPQHSNTRCPVYLHLAAITSPTAVEAIQQRTELLVIINIRRPAIALPLRPVATDDIGPRGGDAA
ncbi:hypothetical protein BK658_24365 [Pseudomonas brassicacearum]|uniref:Uncharacterized protein n=1 Tax=Pseudomonas brassicacearum TaxID=930166 RepID=A0A423GKK1_9PSED|nr:hypothetical protein BK658_24365 [Pseudomonas brassicacearum]